MNWPRSMKRQMTDRPNWFRGNVMIYDDPQYIDFDI